MKDLYYNLYFKDRTGDTFRWRGENVATTEVEGIISKLTDSKECAVYGVTVPHNEGKAGMLAIVDKEDKLNIDKLSVKVNGALPQYARPLFIRVVKGFPMTGTFKVVKKDFASEGFDINKVKDPLYFLSKAGYIRMTKDDYNDILSGTGSF